MIGQFVSGQVAAQWINDGRSMELLRPVSFVDAAGKLWLAPAGSVIDGASIPRVFWRLIGSPFVGRFRRASVIHDVYCVNRLEPWGKVHRVFNEMMRVDGVPAWRRRLMFAAVWFFGPRW
jgi:hypothetical protein